MNPIRMICKFKIKNADVCMYLFFFIFFMQRVFLCYFTLIYSRVSMHSLCVLFALMKYAFECIFFFVKAIFALNT